MTASSTAAKVMNELGCSPKYGSFRLARRLPASRTPTKTRGPPLPRGASVDGAAPAVAALAVATCIGATPAVATCVGAAPAVATCVGAALAVATCVVAALAVGAGPFAPSGFGCRRQRQSRITDRRRGSHQRLMSA